MRLTLTSGLGKLGGMCFANSIDNYGTIIDF